MQVAVVQSPATMQAWPFAHFLAGAQILPPQSASVSVWFLAPSAQVAARQMLVVHTLLAQSVPVVHALLSAQAVHMGPRQSVSVSAAFFTRSVQVGVRQMLPTHTPLEQSAPAMHALPSMHFLAGAQMPPQSLSVSVWFFTPS